MIRARMRQPLAAFPRAAIRYRDTFETLRPAKHGYSQMALAPVPSGNGGGGRSIARDTVGALAHGGWNEFGMRPTLPTEQAPVRVH